MDSRRIDRPPHGGERDANGSEEGMARYLESCRKDFWRRVFQLELEYLVSHLGGCRTVLSVGCGPAVIEGGLAERGFRVTGVDVSRTALGCAPDTVRTIVADAETMALPEESFDAALFVASLQFIGDYRKALDRAAAALNPAGRIIAMLLNPDSAYFKQKSRSSDSYVSKIRHTDLKAIARAAEEHFAVRAEYFMSLQGGDLTASPAGAESILYVVFGEKRPSRGRREDTHA
ncbi:MAG: class I SAM-dependent methyltransferase [Anaerolineales bacterium]|nr:class I SAM-dependent methyltransferase [Anaerolineales bacterium]